MVTPPQHRSLARLSLRRIAVPAVRTTTVEEPWPPASMPYSRTLWGSFMPDRRSARANPPGGVERRRG
jgi:hypothetical protein